MEKWELREIVGKFFVVTVFVDLGLGIGIHANAETAAIRPVATHERWHHHPTEYRTDDPVERRPSAGTMVSGYQGWTAGSYSSAGSAVVLPSGVVVQFE